jgi:hypothetical protein
MTLQTALPVPAELALAGYSLALRITGDEEHAAASVEAACAASHSVESFVRAVREEARTRRAPAPFDPATAICPPRLRSVTTADWAVLERVAHRGMLLHEAAEAVGIDREEALLRLHRGLLAARNSLLGSRQVSDDAHAVRLDRLDGDLTSGRLDDPTRDRQAETAAVARLAS